MSDREYGKFLKKLRIDKDEMLQDMAKRLGIHSSYLSAIESENRDIPVGLTDKIAKEYNLSSEEKQILFNAELNTERKAVQLNLEKVDGNVLAKETALNFASKFSILSQEQLMAINEILKGGDEN